MFTDYKNLSIALSIALVSAVSIPYATSAAPDGSIDEFAVHGHAKAPWVPASLDHSQLSAIFHPTLKDVRTLSTPLGEVERRVISSGNRELYCMPKSWEIDIYETIKTLWGTRTGRVPGTENWTLKAYLFTFMAANRPGHSVVNDANGSPRLSKGSIPGYKFFWVTPDGERPYTVSAQGSEPLVAYIAMATQADSLPRESSPESKQVIKPLEPVPARTLERSVTPSGDVPISISCSQSQNPFPLTAEPLKRISSEMLLELLEAENPIAISGRGSKGTDARAFFKSALSTDQATSLRELLESNPKDMSYYVKRKKASAPPRPGNTMEEIAPGEFEHADYEYVLYKKEKGVAKGVPVKFHGNSSRLSLVFYKPKSV